jgi:hypothetical protein
MISWGLGSRTHDDTRNNLSNRHVERDVRPLLGVAKGEGSPPVQNDDESHSHPRRWHPASRDLQSVEWIGFRIASDCILQGTHTRARQQVTSFRFGMMLKPAALLPRRGQTLLPERERRERERRGVAPPPPRQFVWLFMFGFNEGIAAGGRFGRSID